MSTLDIVSLLMPALIVSGVLYMRFRFPSPSKVEETSARIAVILLFVFLSASFLMFR